MPENGLENDKGVKNHSPSNPFNPVERAMLSFSLSPSDGQNDLVSFQTTRRAHTSTIFADAAEGKYRGHRHNAEFFKYFLLRPLAIDAVPTTPCRQKEKAGT